MERIVAFGKTIRNNWKKSAVGAAALVYAAATIKEKYEINLLMRAACKEATKYGDSLIAMDRNPTMVTVILNPVANKRNAKQNYEKYCEPLLHLAGLQVEVIQTTSEGNAKEIIETLRGTEAIIVAGGDGTLSETVTGLLRRNDNANSFPLGVLPLGRTNTVAKSLFPGGDGVDMVKQLIEACMAIIEGGTVWKDAMKIEPIVQEDEAPKRPIYAMSSVEWGAFRDTLARKDKYWFYGSWRDYAAYIFNGYKESLTWDCSGVITYTNPCFGCSNCIPRKPEVKRNWSFILPKSTKLEQETIVNPECAIKQELCFKTCDFTINTTNQQEQTPSLNVVLGKNKYTYWDFVTEGWNRLKIETGNKPTEKLNKDIAERLSNNHTQVIPVRTVELLPRNVQEDVKIEIDKEEFDVKPVKITLLPKVVKFFCRPQLNA